MTNLNTFIARRSNLQQLLIWEDDANQAEEKSSAGAGEIAIIVVDDACEDVSDEVFESYAPELRVKSGVNLHASRIYAGSQEMT
jgi:hypothetical protein